MVILFFFIIHWYSSLFFQSVFLHRYAAHGTFTMSRRMEKFFYIGCGITQGSSYISAKAYGIMHRLHHAHTDTAADPHAPDNSANMFTLMWDTRNSYFNIYSGKTVTDKRYEHNLPEWDAFDKLAHNWVTRVLWIVGYTCFYLVFATQWWMFLFLPLTIIMGSLHGIAINWWAHRFGYRNFNLADQSRNIMPVDILFLGEAFHNNHHKHPGRPNNAVKWFEVDMGYLFIRLMHNMRMIRLRNPND
jgi:stearoyl-CoA desaturase (Delta-9 desaturase)